MGNEQTNYDNKTCKGIRILKISEFFLRFFSTGVLEFFKSTGVFVDRLKIILIFFAKYAFLWKKNSRVKLFFFLNEISKKSQINLRLFFLVFHQIHIKSVGNFFFRPTLDSSRSHRSKATPTPNRVVLKRTLRQIQKWNII